MPHDDGFSNRYGNDGYNDCRGNRDNDRGNNRVGRYNHNDDSRSKDSRSNYPHSNDPLRNRNGYDDRYRESRNDNGLRHFGQKPQRRRPKVLQVSLFLLFFLNIFHLLMSSIIPLGAF